MRLLVLGMGMVCLAGALAGVRAVAADAPGYSWWPVQKAPAAVVKTHFNLFKNVTTPDGKVIPGALGPDHMLAESLAGLAALAVNEGRSDELVWIGIDNSSYDRWYADTKKRLGFKERGTFTPWELVERYRDTGVYDGYILYTYDKSDSDNPTAPGKDADESVNVATSLSGLLKGLLIAEEQEEQAKALGLRQLADVREKSETWCFETYKDRFNRRSMLTQPPKIPNLRATAIAHHMFVAHGLDSPVPEAYAWLEKPGSILGWNGSDEGGFVAQLSEFGHILLPSNWSLNVTVTSAGAESYEWARPFKTTNPAAIDWDYNDSAVSFIMTDGDNVQWFMCGFCMDKNYWASVDHGAYPVGWGAPYACLDQACPATDAYLVETQPDTSTVILHAGGYYYPDLLGKRLGARVRHELLVTHARRLNHFMKRAGGKTLMFLCMDLDSDAAREAYAVFAQEIEDLVGMFAIQYYPYEGGNGKVYWVKNAEGTDIPVVTAKYAIWAHLKNERAGTPAKIARLINEDARGDDPLLAWTTVHTWSGFKKIDDNDELAENGQFRAEGTEAAITPTRWCVDRLSDQVRVVTPEELLWRIRMQHNPGQTRACIEALK